MKAILLGNKPDKIRAVYDKDAICRLKASAGLASDRIYLKDDILAAPKDFSEVENIFSTWGMPVFTEAEIERCFPHLKAVYYAAGTVKPFAEAFLRKGIAVHSAWAANAIPVAEYTVAQIILANKGFFAASPLQSVGKIAESKAAFAKYPGNYGVKVGIIGAGMVGGLVIKLLKNYHLSVMVYDPFLPQEKADELGVEKCSLETLFSECTVVSNHLANVPETVGILTGSLFRRMLPYATFLNTGRGAQVAESELIEVLSERKDLIAILDVTHPEPPAAESPFFRLDNVRMTPHIAGSSGNEVVRMSAYMCDEFDRVRRGEPPLWRVSLEMLKTMA